MKKQQQQQQHSSVDTCDNDIKERKKFVRMTVWLN